LKCWREESVDDELWQSLRSIDTHEGHSSPEAATKVRRNEGDLAETCLVREDHIASLRHHAPGPQLEVIFRQELECCRVKLPATKRRDSEEDRACFGLLRCCVRAIEDSDA
jgi:hypothetical protein